MCMCVCVVNSRSRNREGGGGGRGCGLHATWPTWHASKQNERRFRSVIAVSPTHPSVPEQSRLHTECVGQDKEGVCCREVGYIQSVGQDRVGVYSRKAASYPDGGL